MEQTKCCICKKEFEGFGNNPEPLKKRGRCCNGCNYLVLIERIKILQSRKDGGSDKIVLTNKNPSKS